jgi:hypothetical protein
MIGSSMARVMAILLALPFIQDKPKNNAECLLSCIVSGGFAVAIR